MFGMSTHGWHICAPQCFTSRFIFYVVIILPSMFVVTKHHFYKSSEHNEDMARMKDVDIRLLSPLKERISIVHFNFQYFSGA